MSVDDVLQSACQFWCNLMSHYQSLCPKVQQQNKTHMGNSSVMDVALCTQKSTFWHQYLERYLCIVIFYDAV